MSAISVTLGVSATPDYAANDVIDRIKTLSNAVDGGPPGAVLTSVTIKEPGGQTPAMTLLFFKATPAGGTYADNTALVWGTNDLANLVGVVRILTTDWITIVSKSMVSVGDIGQFCKSANTDLYMLVIADEAFNASADVTIELGLERPEG